MNFARRFFARPTAIFGFAVFVGVVMIALAAPLLFARGPFTIVGMPLLPPGAPGLLAGSDILGRDMAVGLAFGARISLLIGVTSTLCAVGIGILLGAMAGYYGGLVDDLLMRFTEFFQIIPSFVLLMVSDDLSLKRHTDLFNLGVGQSLNPDKAAARITNGTENFVELGLDSGAVSVLAVLNQKHREERQHGGRGVDDQLPGVRIVE